ncbi:RNA-directed DNA polymerase, eukaryota, reverse transcriptase zinc-binding domain protein [Tanacetum coccineum]
MVIIVVPFEFSSPFEVRLSSSPNLSLDSLSSESFRILVLQMTYKLLMESISFTFTNSTVEVSSTFIRSCSVNRILLLLSWTSLFGNLFGATPPFATEAYDCFEGNTSILVNGSPTSEFSLKRGLRQGDPLSHFLFIIIMEGLHIAFKDGLSSNINRGVNVGSPGLRININKSNLYGVGVSHSEAETIAAGSGCSPSYLPFSYLGLPIGSNMSHISNWKVLIDHFKSRLSGWKASLLSSDGRLTLIKLVLGSLSIYFFSIFKAPKAVIKVLESIRASFFWGASVEKKKLAWVKWSNILAHLEKDPSALWVNVLKSIHGDEADFELAGCKNKWVMGSYGRVYLSAAFKRVLFHLEKNRSCLIRDHIANSSCSWDWSRPGNRGRSQADFNNLLVDISLLNIVNDSDSVVFSLSSDNSFSVNAARKYIDDFNSSNVLPSTRWFKTIPRKVNIFMWHLFLDKLPHRFNFSSCGIDIASIMCPNCNGHVKTNSHIFFSCTTASNIWRLIRGWYGLKLPLFNSCVEWDNWFSSWSASKDNRDRAYAIFAFTCWILWRFRNNVVFNSHFMRICDMI